MDIIMQANIAILMGFSRAALRPFTWYILLVYKII